MMRRRPSWTGPRRFGLKFNFKLVDPGERDATQRLYSHTHTLCARHLLIWRTFLVTRGPIDLGRGGDGPGRLRLHDVHLGHLGGLGVLLGHVGFGPV